jgi:glycosyltransferase involved in cell wall biosynthesis
MVRACHPEAVLVIAGPVDPDQLHLFESLPPGIERIGLVNGSKKAEILLSSGLFVLPSLNENFGVAVAEAMAYGLPVLVTDQVALAEQVRKYHAGEVLTCPTADGLAVALNSWLSRPDARTVAGAAARSMIETSFSTTTVGNTLTSLIAPLAFVESHDS